MKKKYLLFYLLFIIKIIQAQSVTDIDGNVYQTITIGNQVWLKENLKTKHYRNGDIVPMITDSISWSTQTQGARCYFNNDSVNYAATYGALYNWFTVSDPRGICPQGWHVPTDAEWNTLSKFLDNTIDTNSSGYAGTDIGGKLKESGTNHWITPNSGATNSSGFTGLPGGFRDYQGRYPDFTLGYIGYFWTASSYDTAFARDRNLNAFVAQISRSEDMKVRGQSIRCVKDIGANFIEDKSKLGMPRIYLNQSNHLIHIEQSSLQFTKAIIRDALGRSLLQSTLTELKESISTDQLIPGVYWVVMQGNTANYSYKIIVE